MKPGEEKPALASATSPGGQPDPWEVLATAAAALAAIAATMRPAGASPPLALFRPEEVPTVSQMINEMLIAKARCGRSDRYLRQLRVSLSNFARTRAAAEVSAVTVHDVEKWIYSRGFKPKTMRGYLGDVKALFAFAIRRGHIRVNPAAGVELPPGIISQKPPAIHSPEQVQAVLEACRRFHPDVCRMVAIRYFTGVRTSEAHRLREENILETGFIEVPAEKSKTRRRRLIKIEPNLKAWLALGGRLRPIRPDTIRTGIHSAGVPWPSNVTRHSFVTYHLAKFENAGKTALAAGHTETILFHHYRELATPDQAETFWGIVPELPGGLLGPVAPVAGS